MNEKYGIPKLLELVRDIERNPSQLHCKCRHKDAPQTPDFDWNVFVDRIDTMAKEDRIANSPFRQVRLALTALNADLTYENRKRAKTILHNMMDTLKDLEDKDQARHQKDKEQLEEEKSMFLTSSNLTDEFWKNALKDSQQCKCSCKNCQYKPEKSQESDRHVLKEEKMRYSQIVENYISEIHEKICDKVRKPDGQA